MTLAIDFDQVIHDTKNPIPGRRMGGPILGAKEALERLKKRGDTIIVFTVWGGDAGRKTISDWMNYYQIPFDSITNIKPSADAYIDDKGIRFNNWEEVLRLI